MSDFEVGALMIGASPKTRALLGDKGMTRLVSRSPDKTRDCSLNPVEIQSRDYIPRDALLYRQRHQIENMFRKLTGVTPATTTAPVPSCPAICIAATVIFWINQSVLSLTLSKYPPN